jgi:hypothetical protein
VSPELAGIAAIVETGGEADDVLRAVVGELVSSPEISWAGIAFAEGGALVLGPEAGVQRGALRKRAPVLFDGEPVAELSVDGDVTEAFLEGVAQLLGPHCLVGWDTGGVPWGEAS